MPQSMPISQASTAEWNCAHCGAVTPRLTWLAVDAEERRDLIAQLSDLIRCDCSSCLGPMQRSQPLLVLRLAHTAPLIVAYERDDDPDPLSRLGDVIDTVQRELGDALSSVPGPALRVTFNEIEAGARFDIDADLEEMMAHPERTTDPKSAYTALLGKIMEFQSQRRISAGLTALALVGDESQLRSALGEYPELASEGAEEQILERLASATTDEQRAFADSMLQSVLFLRARRVREAWTVREATLNRYHEEVVLPRLREFEDQARTGTRRRLAEAGIALLAVLPSEIDPELEAEVATKTAAALLEDGGVDRDENIEKAIELSRTTESILNAHPSLDLPHRRLQIATNLGVAYGMRLRGDTTWNICQGIEHLSEILSWFPRAADPDSWAMAHTNLALLLINRGDAEDHDIAKKHLQLALTHRSFARNPRDWAFTQLNLAVAYARTASGSPRSNVKDSIRHAAKARRAAIVADDTRILAQAHHNLASEQFRLSQMDGTSRRVRSKLLRRAIISAAEAARLSSVVESPLQYGRIKLMMGRILLNRGELNQAVEALREAVAALTVDIVPTEAREASRLLMELAQQLRDRELAADAAGRLVEAASAAISSHSRMNDRFAAQHQAKSTDFRFAAHALSQADRHVEALVALEAGQARELDSLTFTERLDLQTLAYLDPKSADRLGEIHDDLRTDALELEQGEPSDLAERHAAARDTVHRLPTFENALGQPTLDEICEAAVPRCPLVYLGAAPAGSITIAIDRNERGDFSIETMKSPDCGSGEIARLAIAGLNTRDGLPRGTPYIAAQAHAPEEVDSSLEALTPLIGEHLLKPVARWLTDRGATGVTLIPTGLLALMPLHAICWSESSGTRRNLIEDYEVTFAPSARLRLLCLQRASQRTGSPIRFVGVANPLPHPNPLPGAELEIKQIRGILQNDECLTLEGKDATKEVVAQSLSKGTHIHLACHAAGRFFGAPLSAAFSLSNGEQLSALEIARLRIEARLVVASACETGVTQQYDQIDESLGLASAFLAAGAAGVVSTLWAVDDFAAALVVSRFYEELWGTNASPEVALRTAQLWLRDADADTIDEYALRRTALRELRDGRRSYVAPTYPNPYSAPANWAAFIFSGA